MKQWLFPILTFTAGYLLSREGSSRIAVNEETTAQSSARSERSIRSWAVGHGDDGGGFASRFQVLVANNNHSAKYELLKEWFRADSDAAMEAINKLPIDMYNNPSLLLEFLFGDDPIAMEAMGRHLDDIIVEGWYNSGFGLENHERLSFDFSEGRSLVEKVESLPETDAKKHLWNHVMAGWFYKDWKEAAGWVDSMAGSERSAAERAFLSEIIPSKILQDEEGRKWILKVLSQEENRDLLFRHGASVVSAMAVTDPKKALEWADENLGGLTLKAAVSSMLEGVAYRTPEKLAEIVDGLPLGGVKQQASETMILSMARKDAQGAYDQALEQQAAGIDLRDEAWGQLGRALGATKPEEAREILANLEGDSNKAFRSNATQNAFDKQPEETKQWAAEMKEDKREEIIDLVFKAWSSNDQKKAEAWREGLRR